MAEEQLGDIFWDLAPWVYYLAGYDLGCIIYVVNHTDVEKEYTLLNHVYKDGVLLTEGSLLVDGYAWFTVSPGDFIKLHGTMKFDVSDGQLTVSLIEKETQGATDTVSTMLVTPATATLPPGWPGPGAPTTPTTDWMSMIMTVMVVMMMMKMMASAIGPEKNKELAAQGA